MNMVGNDPTKQVYMVHEFNRLELVDARSDREAIEIARPLLQAAKDEFSLPRFGKTFPVRILGVNLATEDQIESWNYAARCLAEERLV